MASLPNPFRCDLRRRSWNSRPPVQQSIVAKHACRGPKRKSALGELENQPRARASAAVWIGGQSAMVVGVATMSSAAIWNSNSEAR